MPTNYCKGIVRKLHSFRQDTDNMHQFAQQWTVAGENGEQYLLSIKEGQEVKVLLNPKKPGMIKIVEVDVD